MENKEWEFCLISLFESIKSLCDGLISTHIYYPLTIVVQSFKYRSGTVNSKSFVGKVLLRIKWKFELTYAL